MNALYTTRRARSGFPLLVASLLMILLAGCAGSSSYRFGTEQMAAGNYSEAAASLRRAVAEDPDNRAYLRALDHAETRAAEQHFDRARQFWHMNQAWHARDELEQVFLNVPAHPQAMLLNESVHQRIAEVDHLTQQARTQLETGDPDLAEALARQAYELDSSHPSARALAQEMSLIGQEPLPVVDEQEAIVRTPVHRDPPAPSPSASLPEPSPDATRDQEIRSPEVEHAKDEEPSDAPRRIVRIVLSREDDQYRKRQAVTDGILIELKDTDGHPLDADLEVRVGRKKFKHKDQRVGAQIPVTGTSGRQYRVVIIAIVDKHETVVLDLITNVE